MVSNARVDPGTALIRSNSTRHSLASLSYTGHWAKAEKKLLRKLDWILVPMLLLTATMGAVDKVAINLGLVGQQYSWAGSILFIGCIVGMCPSSYLVQRFPSAKYLSSCSFGWSRMALLIPACKSWSGLMTIRFLMAVRHIPESAPLAIGNTCSISAMWSITMIILLPDSPMNTFFLTAQERCYAVQRVAQNKTGIVNKEWKLDQALEAIIDRKTWVLFFFNIAINIPNGGVTTFSGILFKNLGFSAARASLLNMPTGFMSTAAAFLFSWIAARWSNRPCLVTMIASCLPIVGSAIVYALPRTIILGQMAGIYLLYTYFGSYVVGISMAQANTVGHTKKTVQYSIMYIGYAVGNLIEPQIFRADQAPAYTGGFIAMTVCYSTCVGLIGISWLLVTRLNRRLGSVDTEVGAIDGDERAEMVFCDRTDLQQKTFIYIT
ncbi:MFS general substrate transporter [Aspergillus ellipticus CBS 707.79]|uniref:MFS general substrate transporter n=1 Tax=Aspergillus ellipticus CBS 707.79 TaxID=1448320 RepID=A0A319ETG7_9EURO|nr:MFS general substrate transporter [Aspergillus ellipticus CBS 707.79]